ncbi:isocitrate lyase/PEP mutase family protein [Hwanghaeella sp.]|uniref:isocitrate lyase/PEP mutase family protein n=1 Tax=Hwanghaeella sp. TaxID=2605943 RepID=UPI003CCC1E03
MSNPPLPPLMAAASRLRARLADGKIVAAPGAPDALTARLVEKAGFDAVYMTGLGATAARVGQPDLSILTQTEMADHARAMVRAVGIPVIADADTGYGGPLNMRRTVREYIQAGAGAMHIEDQISPKRCGQLSGVRLVTRQEGVLRLKAAVEARAEAGSDVVIIGRTDALQPEGLDAALDRARAYADAGVDLLFVDGVKTRKEVEGIAAGLDAPKIVSIVDGTDAANLTLSDLQQMGFCMALYAVTTLFTAAAAVRSALDHLKAQGSPQGIAPQISYAEFCEIVGLAEFQEFAHRHETVG